VWFWGTSCTTICLCAQLNRWSANYTFKTEIVCYRHRHNGNYCRVCSKDIQLQTHLQTYSHVIETIFSTNWAGFDPLNENWSNKDFSRTRPLAIRTRTRTRTNIPVQYALVQPNSINLIHGWVPSMSNYFSAGRKTALNLVR